MSFLYLCNIKQSRLSHDATTPQSGANSSAVATQQSRSRKGPERPVSVCREISKIHEESVRGTLSEVAQHFIETEPRGEIVVVVGGATETSKKQNKDNDKVL